MRIQAAYLVLLIAVLVVVVGCSDNPTAPTAPSERVPSAPTGVKATNGPGTYIIWEPVNPTYTSLAGSRALPVPVYYNIYWSTSPGVTAKNGNKIPNVLSPAGFVPAFQADFYYLVVTAVTASNESAESEEVVTDWRPK